jgi:hypothetical protein
MRFSASSLRIVIAAAAAVLILASPGHASHAKKAAADSTSYEAPAPPVPPAPPTPPTTVRKKITIGGSGVRIHEEGGDAADDTSDVKIQIDFDSNARDHGDDIVKIAESVFVPAGKVVPGDVVVFGGNAIIEGTVAGSVVVMGGEIRARRGAEIKGDVVAIGGTIEEDEEVVIRGERILVGGVASQIGDRLHIGTRTIRAIVSVAMLFVGFVLFLITMLFLRGRVERVSSHVTAYLLKCLGMGVLTSVVGMFALLIVMIPLIITIVGIPLAMVLGISCIGVYVIACTIFVFTVGRAVATRAGIDGGVFAHLLIGIVLLSIPEIMAFVLDSVGHAPMAAYVMFKVISGFVWLFAYVVGLGAIVVSRFGARPVEPAPPATRVVGEPAGLPAS